LGEFLPYKWKILNSGELLPYKWRILNSERADSKIFALFLFYTEERKYNGRIQIVQYFG
jgi:hypothetical protein